MATYNGTNGANTLIGTQANDFVYGFGGNDTLSGLGGNDTIDGGTGNDTVTGGTGADRMTGGAGNDTFVYLSGLDSVPNANWATPPSPAALRTWDVITDFTQGADRIDVSAFLGSTDLAWANFTPTGNAVWFAKSGTSTFVYADVGGVEPPELMIELQNTSGLILTPTDFIGVTGSGGGANTAPVITSPATFNVAENTTAVTTVTATDAQAQAITFSLAAGGDAARFAINSKSGVLGFVTAPDFEAPADVGADNVYNVTVQASDGSLATTQAIAVTVTNVVNETLTGGSGADTIVGSTGNDVITGNGGADRLTGNAGNDTFVYLAASDSVPNANWAIPPLPAATPTWDVITDFTQGVDRIDVSAFLGATDLAWANFTPTGDAVWYAKSGTSTFVYADVGGVEPPELMIELQNTSGLILTPNDFIGVVGSGGTNAAPVITSPATFNVAENSTAVTTVTATDAQAQPIAYSLVAGGDAALFAINATTGALGFVNPPNFEAPADVGADNVYNFTVQASDGSLATTQTIAVTVTDVVNELIINGTPANDTLVGTGGDDAFDISQGGNDTVSAGEGSDTIFAGAAFTASDRIDGGTESSDNVQTDALVLSGNYSAGVTLDATTLTNVELIALTAGNNYKLTMHDATLSNSTLAIDGSQLTAANSMTIDASAETQSTSNYTMISGAGSDLMIGGAASDFFDLSLGGNDTVSAGGGHDTIDAAGAFSAGDRIDGGPGTDFLYLSGNYAGGVIFDTATLTNTEVLVTQAGNSYSLTPSNGTLAPGQSLTIDGSALSNANTLLVNASAETDATASYTLKGGAGNDNLRGGAGNDLIIGNGGVDILTGGLGNDTFDYNRLTDRGTSGDAITDFSKAGVNGNDILDLHDLLQSFAGYNGSNAFTGGYLQFDISSGASTVVNVDSNGGADSFVPLTTITTIPPTLLLPTDTGNFIL